LHTVKTQKAEHTLKATPRASQKTLTITSSSTTTHNQAGSAYCKGSTHNSNRQTIEELFPKEHSTQLQRRLSTAEVSPVTVHAQANEHHAKTAQKLEANSNSHPICLAWRFSTVFI